MQKLEHTTFRSGTDDMFDYEAQHRRYHNISAATATRIDPTKRDFH
jgi:hypothetical protein